MLTTPQHTPPTADTAASSAALQAALQSPGDLPPLAEFVDLPGLLPHLQPTFPTQESIRWFVRSHRDTLSRSGALIALAGRLHFHPGRFARVAVEIGRRNAGLPTEGGA